MNTEQPVQRDCTTPDACRWPRCSCECVNGPAIMVSIPREADDAMLRPFYGCPPEELPLAWQAMLAVVAAKKRRAHGVTTGDAPCKRWPFVESPGEFTERLAAAMREFPTLLAAVRYVLIETPPTFADGVSVVDQQTFSQQTPMDSGKAEKQSE